MPASALTLKIEIGNQLDGSIDGFASRFWDTLKSQAGNLLG